MLESAFHGANGYRYKKYKHYLVQYHGTAAEDLLVDSKKRIAKWNTSEWSQVKAESNGREKMGL
ncbi:MAG: hypothetical protein ACTHJ4_01195 [Candidatus Nucleicultricaceae bacterium]